jgi:hypothetical protein
MMKREKRMEKATIALPFLVIPGENKVHVICDVAVNI